MASGARTNAQNKFSEMERRQKQALHEEDIALEATRAKTVRLRALRLKKEEQDALDKAELAKTRLKAKAVKKPRSR